MTTDIKVTNLVDFLAIVALVVAILFIGWCVTQPAPKMVSNTTTITYNVTYVNVTVNCCNCSHAAPVKAEVPSVSEIHVQATHYPEEDNPPPSIPQIVIPPASVPPTPTCEFPWWCD